MPEPNTVVQLTSAELTDGTIKSVTVPGEGGIEQTVQIRIPPGVADGTLLRIPAPEGDHYVRISLDATLPPTATPLATPPAGFTAPLTAAPPAFGPSARSRRRIVLFTGVAAAVVVIVVALITATAGPTTPGTPTPQAAPPAPTTTTQPPESAADYQQALNGLATALNNGLAELGNAGTPAAISTAVTDFGNGIQQAEGAFDAVPPTDIKTANDALVAALHTVTGEGLISVSSAAGSDRICLGPSATALLSRAISLDQLRQAITTLTAAGYQFGASIPPVTQDGSRAANTGAIVAGGVKHGLGQLTITNGGDTDATVGLVAGQGAPLVTVYMGHGGTFTLHHVPDGTYTIYVTGGDDWDGGARLFSRDCDFEQFDQTMDFTTTSTEYTTYTITLTPVAGGNASETSVDPGSFPH
jgi:hypothetical protein